MSATRRLLLVGGGHAHAIVLEQFTHRPVPAGIELVMVSRDARTPYSGMLPGHVAGHYAHDELHIDLPRLCQRADVRFVHDEVTALSPDDRTILLSGGESMSADIIALDIGSAPDLTDAGPGATGVTPVKPISGFVERWHILQSRVAEGETPNIGVVGGGAGGTEMALAIHHCLTHRGDRVAMTLVTGSSGVLPDYPTGVRRYFERVLARRGIEVRRSRVARVTAGTAVFDDGTSGAFDELLWATSAGAQSWVGASGLATDARGFMRVGDTLESVSHPGIFGAGDCATMDAHPRDKAGVFAVRQGPPLADNLRRAMAGEPGLPYLPQKRFLSLISTGGRNAVATRGGRFHAAGRWVWRWKDHIDRAFMTRFA